MVDYEQIDYQVLDGILTITLARPEKLNAFTARMKDELCDAFDRSDENDDVRAVIVTGRGRAFCAGADISKGGERFGLSENASATNLREDRGGIVALRIFRSNKPIIAAINGPAVGIGITMTLPMDIRIMATDARLGFVFTRRGIAPEACSSWFLPRIVGISRAAEWCYSGRLIDAEEALASGLVRSVHDSEQLLPAAQAVARQLVDGTSPVAVAVTRQLLWRMLAASHPSEAHTAGSKAVNALGSSADAEEGISAFLEHRQAVFPLRVSTDVPLIW